MGGCLQVGFRLPSGLVDAVEGLAALKSRELSMRSKLGTDLAGEQVRLRRLSATGLRRLNGTGTFDAHRRQMLAAVG
jgi:hypothetical protein